MDKYIKILIVHFTNIKSCLFSARNKSLFKNDFFYTRKKPNILLITLAFKTIDHIELNDN